jgi:hypothetical protein
MEQHREHRVSGFSLSLSQVLLRTHPYTHAELGRPPRRGAKNYGLKLYLNSLYREVIFILQSLSPSVFLQVRLKQLIDPFVLIRPA